MKPNETSTISIPTKNTTKEYAVKISIANFMPSFFINDIPVGVSAYSVVVDGT